MIETDILYAYVKTRDWLKPVASKLIHKIARADLGEVYASREVFHELYYVSREEGVELQNLIQRAAALSAIPNLSYLDTTAEIDLLALTLMKQYSLVSIFDAYHAATALNQVEDHTIISTDEVFDKIPGLFRKDPRHMT